MKLRLLLFPVIFISMFQLAGCARVAKPAAAPLPGGTYLSQSAGGFFQQSVSLANGEGNIAGLTLLGSHRPLYKPQDVYVAAGKTGLVYSSDSGSTWSIWAVPLAYVSDVVALEDGVVAVSGIDTAGQGYIVRTADQGKTWESVLTIPVPIKTGGFKLIGNNNAATPQSVVIAIAPDPFHPDRVYAGTTLGNILVGEQSAKTWRTLYTLSAGPYAATNQSKLAINNIIPSPFKDGEVLVITGDSKLFRIANQMQTELKISRVLDKTKYSVEQGQYRSVLSASYVADSPEALFVGVDDGAVISRDAGKTWKQVNLPVDTAKKFNTAVVTASPTNSTRLFVGINSVFYRSEDGGQTWNSFTLGLATHVITSILIDSTKAADVLLVTTPAKS